MAQQETTADAAMKRRTVSTHRQQQQAAKQHRPPAASAPPRFLLPAGAGTAFRNAAAGRRVTNNGFCNLHEISFVPVECARTDAVMLFPMQYNGCVNSKTLNQLVLFCSKPRNQLVLFCSAQKLLLRSNSNTNYPLVKSKHCRSSPKDHS